jgi:hypothetical protein
MNDEIALSRLLDQFLFEHPEPTSADWRAVLKAHPEFRKDIADFAATFASLRHVTEDDVRSNFFTMNERSDVTDVGTTTSDPLAFLDNPEGQDELIHEFRLERYQELVLGVLIGQVKAAAKILEYIATKAAVSLDDVNRSFNDRREELAVSMSSREKPQAFPFLSWKDEVERLVADAQERKRLIALDEE